MGVNLLTIKNNDYETRHFRGGFEREADFSTMRSWCSNFYGVFLGDLRMGLLDALDFGVLRL